MTTALQRLRSLRIVPVIVIDDARQAERLADALVDGGLPCAEVTFRTAAAAEAIQRMRAHRPEMLVGAGTVLTSKQAAEARGAGAQFIVSPGLNPAVVADCQTHDIEIFPGVCTPTEIEMALSEGITTVKFFPAEPMGGLKFLKAISAPYSMVDFIPTGGISTANITEYLAFKKVIACGGSWMAPADWIAAGEFDRIREETARAVASTSDAMGAVR
jgi:2-dehydro-3-deoxyphosphogluconate aldolase / (4S)-4-hydroxy-2-oxoglutarate aldolase